MKNQKRKRSLVRVRSERLEELNASADSEEVVAFDAAQCRQQLIVTLSQVARSRR